MADEILVQQITFLKDVVEQQERNLFLRRRVALLDGAEPLEYCFLMCHVQTEDRKPDQVPTLNYLEKHTLEEPRNW